MSDGGDFLTYVCDGCILLVPGANAVRELAADHRDAEDNHFVRHTPFRCVRCEWVE